jgi:hypothetical protein
MNEQEKTFEKLDIRFENADGCLTCGGNDCHNNVSSKRNGIEYNVHIAADFMNNVFKITANENPNTFSKDDIDEIFDNEHDAVDFLCKNFERFTCM